VHHEEEELPDYKVTVEGSDPFPLTAPNPSAARNWAVRDKVKVEPLTARDAIAFGKAGMDITDISALPEEPEPLDPGKKDGQEGGDEPEVKPDGQEPEPDAELKPKGGEVEQSPKQK
jgi:hypothetical protein